VLPDENEKDCPDLPLEIREKVRFSLVSRVEEALPILFPGIDGTKKSGARRTPLVKKASGKKAKG
jgi:ATP-dependent Lon protease